MYSSSEKSGAGSNLESKRRPEAADLSSAAVRSGNLDMGGPVQLPAPNLLEPVSLLHWPATLRDCRELLPNHVAQPNSYTTHPTGARTAARCVRSRRGLPDSR